MSPDGRTRTASKIGLTMLVLGLVGVVAGVGTYSAFSDTAASDGNTFAAGTVSITDNDQGSALFDLTNLAPGRGATRCIEVTYTGSLDAAVTLFGAVGGSGLAQYLDLEVTRGTAGSGSTGCESFVPDAKDYLGAGDGVIFDGTLSAYPSSFETGIADAPGAGETWATGESRVYRFQVTLQDTDSAQGLNATAGFTWEARNL